MKKKFSIIAALALVTTLFAGCLTGFAATPDAVQVDSYADVGEDSWAYPWVTFMTQKGYIHGYPTEENDGLQVYKPDQLITRAEFVTILYFMLNPQGNRGASFADLSADDWYYEYISKAVANGYMSGYGDDTVKPNAYITREEATSIVYRAFKIDKYTDVTSFTDADDISAWAYEAIMSLADLGIIVGYTGEAEDSSYIQPHVNITRAEVASLLANADKFYPASVQLGEAAVSYTEAAGGKVSVDMFPKNTTDSLSVSVAVESDTDYTVSYNKDGETKTVTAAELADVAFTADELAAADLTVNFPNAKDGDKKQITITVTDNGSEEVVGERAYDVELEKLGGGTGTTTPGGDSTGSGSISGGGSSVKYTVTYVDEEGNTLGTESVKSGKYPANVPAGDADKVYRWEKNDVTVVPGSTAITGTTTFTRYEDRDRVVEALKGYQAMADQGTDVATVNVLSGDAVAEQTDAHDHTNDTWWSNDILAVIVTNDNNHLADGEYDNVVADKVLLPTYDDVARYVVDNSDLFKSASVTITTANKFEYVKLFRAMVTTIDATADAAITAYTDAKTSGTATKEEAYDAFKVAAVTAAASSLNTAIADLDLDDTEKAELVTLALGYVDALAAENGGLADIKDYLESVYGDADFANKVKAEIAGTTIYAR